LGETLASLKTSPKYWTALRPNDAPVGKYRLGDVGRDRIGRRDIDEERHAPLLGHGDHRRRAAGVEGAHQHLGTLGDDALGFGPPHLRLGLGIPQDQLELRASQGLDAAGGVDGVGGHLSAQPARLSRLGERPRHGVDDADLEGGSLGAQDRGKTGEGGGACRRSGRLEESPAISALARATLAHRDSFVIYNLNMLWHVDRGRTGLDQLSSTCFSHVDRGLSG
jgi:hypothetical protein